MVLLELFSFMNRGASVCFAVSAPNKIPCVCTRVCVCLCVSGVSEGV